MVLGNRMRIFAGNDEHLHTVRHWLAQNHSLQQQLQHHHRKGLRCQLPTGRPHLVNSSLFSFNTLDLPEYSTR